MSYIKAEYVLPQELLELIQDYVDGEYLYIPRKIEKRKNWGETTDTKNVMQIRNQEIYVKYKNGVKTAYLAEEYFLSEKSIQRIVLQEKKK
jgi:hypothetical protein